MKRNTGIQGKKREKTRKYPKKTGKARKKPRGLGFCQPCLQGKKMIFIGWGGMQGWLNCTILTPAIESNLTPSPCLTNLCFFRIGKFFKISQYGYGKFFNMYGTIYKIALKLKTKFLFFQRKSKLLGIVSTKISQTLDPTEYFARHQIILVPKRIFLHLNTFP